jgi:Flp pilus assembly protein TadB
MQHSQVPSTRAPESLPPLVGEGRLVQASRYVAAGTALWFGLGVLVVALITLVTFGLAIVLSLLGWVVERILQNRDRASAAPGAASVCTRLLDSARTERDARDLRGGRLGNQCICGSGGGAQFGTARR